MDAGLLGGWAAFVAGLLGGLVACSFASLLACLTDSKKLLTHSRGSQSRTHHTYKPPSKQHAAAIPRTTMEYEPVGQSMHEHMMLY